MWCLRLVVSLEHRLRQCSLHARTEMPKLPQSQPFIPHRNTLPFPSLNYLLILRIDEQSISGTCLPSFIMYPCLGGVEPPIEISFHGQDAPRSCASRGLSLLPHSSLPHSSRGVERVDRPIQIHTISSFTTSKIDFVAKNQRLSDSGSQKLRTSVDLYICSLHPTPLSLTSTGQQDPAFTQLAGSVAKHLPHLESVKC